MAFERKSDDSVQIIVKLGGKAEKLVAKKIEEIQKLGVAKFGKERAINTLLAELYDLKYSK